MCYIYDPYGLVCPFSLALASNQFCLFCSFWTGVHASRWVSTHGIALNCNIDLSWFNHFTPCGIEGKGVTSLSVETNQNIQPQDTIPAFIESFQNIFDCTILNDTEEDLREKSNAQSTVQ